MDVRWARACDFSSGGSGCCDDAGLFSEEEEGWELSESAPSLEEEVGESGEVENVGRCRWRGGGGDCCCLGFDLEENGCCCEGAEEVGAGEEEEVMRGVRARSVRWRARWGC